MAREFGRNQRVADLLQREVALLLQKEVSIKEAGLITISFVDVSPDLRNASIYFTCLQPTCTEEAIVDLLNEEPGTCATCWRRSCRCGQCRNWPSASITP